MNVHRIASLALSSCLVASVCLAGAGPALAARPPKTATLALTFTVTDGRCYPTETATWAGYQVNRIRFIGYVEGRSGSDYAWFDTKTYPKGETYTSGTMISTAFVAARPGEGWYGYAIFRSNGGSHLAEVYTPVIYAPADCLYP